MRATRRGAAAPTPAGTAARRSWRLRPARRTAARSAGRRRRSPSSSRALADGRRAAGDGRQRRPIARARRRCSRRRSAAATAPSLNLIGRDRSADARRRAARTAARSCRTIPARCTSAAALGVASPRCSGRPTSATTAARSATRTSVVLTHPVWCRPCMLRECPLDHRCMRGIDVDARASTRRQRRDACRTLGARRLPRPRRHAHRRSRLSRSRRARRAVSRGRVDAIRALNRAGLRGRRRHESVGRGARLLHRGGRRRRASRTSRRCSPRAARASTRITIVRTIRTARSPSYAQRLRLPQAGARAGRPRGRASSASIRRARSSSATAGSTSRWRARSARRASWCAPATAPSEERKPPADVDGRRGRRQSDRSRELDPRARI